MSEMKEMKHICDVTPKIQKWSVKVIVHEKTQPRISNTGGARHQRLVLMDDLGQKVMATIYGSDIDMFKDEFRVSGTYVISNAKVKPLEDRYNKFNYPYQWTINRTTVFHEETSAAISRSLLKASFTKFSDLQKAAATNEVIDILAIVIRKKEPRTFLSKGKQHIVREFAVLNEEKKPLVLTLWNSVAESEGKLVSEDNQAFPIISATALVYSPFYDGSLGSTPSTVIVVDPPIPEAQNLSNWRLNNMKIVAEMVNAKNYFARDDSSLPISGDVYHSIADVVADSKEDKFLVKGSARITDISQKFFYMCCQKCHSGISADFDYAYTCVACKEATMAKPREMVRVNLYDDTGSLDVTVFGEQSQKILGINGLECMEIHNSGNILAIDEINSDLSAKIFLAKLRRKQRIIGETTTHQYAVIKLEELEQILNQNTPAEIMSEAPNQATNPVPINRSPKSGTQKTTSEESASTSASSCKAFPI